MTPPMAVSIPTDVVVDAGFVAAGLVAFVVFMIAARVVGHLVAEQLSKRHVRADMVVLGRRVITFALLGVGLMVAFGFAIQSANVTLLGIVLATVVAAFGVQDLLKDYVSGYYVLLERHIRVGDRITLDEHTGTVTDVRLRLTILRTDGGDVIVVPNSELFTKAVTIHGHAAASAQPKTERSERPE